jgi:hypothetical protein
MLAAQDDNRWRGNVVIWPMDLGKRIGSLYEFPDEIRFRRTPGQQAESSDIDIYVSQPL